MRSAGAKPSARRLGSMRRLGRVGISPVCGAIWSGGWPKSMEQQVFNAILSSVLVSALAAALVVLVQGLRTRRLSRRVALQRRVYDLAARQKGVITSREARVVL